MLTVAQEHLHALNPSASLVAYGQEINDESYAICKSDLLIKGQDISKISVGDTLANDQNIGQQFDFMLSNPPFGVEWKKIQPQIQKGHELHGFDGRFGRGLPRVSDGSLLFLRFRFCNSHISADSAAAGPAPDSLRSAMAIQRLSVVTESPKSFAICARGASPLRATSITSWRNSVPYGVGMVNILPRAQAR